MEQGEVPDFAAIAPCDTSRPLPMFVDVALALANSDCR
jgi:hypothetical protein